MSPPCDWKLICSLAKGDKFEGTGVKLGPFVYVGTGRESKYINHTNRIMHVERKASRARRKLPALSLDSRTRANKAAERAAGKITDM